MTARGTPTVHDPASVNPGAERELALVFAADEGFARPTAVAMHSALIHLSSIRPEIYLLDNGITQESRERLGSMVWRVAAREIRWIEVPVKRLVNHRGLPHLTSTSYSRLLLAELLPPDVRRAVYLDGDLVVKDDIGPLFQVPLKDAAFAAVRDFVIGTTDSEESSVRGLAEPKPYFNAGVLVIDMGRWRAERFGHRALEFAQSVREPLPLADQDAMNVVADSWHELDFRWNVQPMMMWKDVSRTELSNSLARRFDDLYREAAIVHYAAFPKPWHPYCTSPGMMLWARALIRSGWYEPTEAARWFAQWMGKRVIDAVRRAGHRVRRRKPLGL